MGSGDWDKGRRNGYSPDVYSERRINKLKYKTKIKLCVPFSGPSQMLQTNYHNLQENASYSSRGWNS